HWIDIRNSDCILIMGSNAAENHPISMKWVGKAMDKGATLISVDPRFTRTSSKADIYAALRSGTDIAFLGGMMNYILSNNKFHEEYAANYTNASFIVGSKFDFKDGLFSGYDPKAKKYDKSQWAFEKDGNGVPKRDLSLKDPRCVFQLMKKHYSRYTPKSVSAITGTPEADLKKVYETYAKTGAVDKTGTIMYAMGWTQHTVGVQNIRMMAMIQLMLGNMGRPGGGVNALRGESNVQGSTDHCLLFHIWPGYLGTPNASLVTLADYNAKNTPKTNDPLSANWWQNKPKYMASFLKAMFGEAATKENDFGYSWMPKLDVGTTYSWLDIFDEMYKGNFKGFFAWGQNPACSGANSNKTRQAMAKLDWMVNVNIFDNETASFWKGPGMNPGEIKTEVFFLPCLTSVEKEGSITNSGRWMQWRYAAAKPPRGPKGDGDIMVELFEKVRELYEAEGKFPEPIKNLRWDYVKDGKYDPHAIAKLINGYFEQDVTIKDKSYKKGTLVPSFAFLLDDGSTSSGNWLYCNSYTEKGNMAARREKKDPTGMGLYPEWSWCWPVNRRIIYNRAAVDLNGKPWSPNKNILEYKDGKWVGDVPDGGWPPMSNKEKTKRPFIMKPDGVGSVFGPGRVDGPFPEHYEPLECPVPKNLMSSQRINPVAPVYGTEADAHFSCDPRFPFVCTTYRVTEHWQTGILTRWQPWLLELQPQLFVEMSNELGKLKGINNGDMCKVSSARGEVEAVAIVTGRFKPFKVQGTTVHQIGLPWCFGWVQPKDGGDSANLLTPSTGDPNTRIPETKAFMVNVDKIGKRRA
ncbi:MAG: formate dehydrogenase-N subunit alpha, partial [Desulfobacteraceae bacterium]|nr:formate dehydrogenase-N subunit alpha [Desulfobacteraceae bacterium]